MAHTITTPMRHLKQAMTTAASAWEQLDQWLHEQNQHAAKHTLSPTGLLALSEWSDQIRVDPQAKGGSLSLRSRGDVARLAAMGLWRYEKGVFSFCPDYLSRVLSSMSWVNEPVGVLSRLPQWSVYIDTPQGSWNGASCVGFWAHLDWDKRKERQLLRLVVNCDYGLVTFNVPLMGDSLGACVAFALSYEDDDLRWDDESGEASEQLLADLSVVMALLNALCQPESDMSSASGLLPVRRPWGGKGRRVPEAPIRYCVRQAKPQVWH